VAGVVQLPAAELAAAGLAGAHALTEVEPDVARCRAEAAAVLADLAAAVLPRYLPPADTSPRT
jgi:glycerate kinase